MVVDDLDHENSTDVASKASYDDEFDERITVAITHPLYLAQGDTTGISLISFQLIGLTITRCGIAPCVLHY